MKLNTHVFIFNTPQSLNRRNALEIPDEMMSDE
jgi:hypothetical protein